MSTRWWGPGHATYSGPKHPQADVENLVLYNVDQGGASFRNATAHGVRFELVPGRGGRPPSGRAWASCYAYRIAPRGENFSAWRRVRELASFERVDLGVFPSTGRLAQVWLALREGEMRVTREPLARGRPFSLRLVLGSPLGSPASPELVKSVVDGTVTALQAHRDPSTVGELSARLEPQLGASAEMLAAALQERTRAVLGVKDRLLYTRARGVQWSPDDEHCLAGEVLIEPVSGGRWTLAGVVEAIEPV